MVTRTLPRGAAPSGASAMLIDHYTYVARFNALGAGSSAEAVINIENDAAFDLRALSFFADNGTLQTENTRVLPRVLIGWSTQDSRRFSSQPVPLPTLFGDGQSPMVLPRARRFNRRTVLTFDATNNEAVSLNLWLLLIGEKVFNEA